MALETREEGLWQQLTQKPLMGEGTGSQRRQELGLAVLQQ